MDIETFIFCGNMLIIGAVITLLITYLFTH